MKRITQILASVLFIITVLTIYLAFDFAINNAVSHKNSHKHSLHEQDHHHYLHDDIKTTKRRSTPSLSILNHTKKLNETIKHHIEHDLNNNERRIRNNKQVKPRAKPGNFHKGKTGVKVNKPQKLNQQQRRRFNNNNKTAIKSFQ